MRAYYNLISSLEYAIRETEGFLSDAEERKAELEITMEGSDYFEIVESWKKVKEEIAYQRAYLDGMNECLEIAESMANAITKAPGYQF